MIGIAVLAALVLETVTPLVLSRLGFQNAAVYSIFPGFYPILWATHGYLQEIAPLGYVIMYSINTIVYGVPIYCLLACCYRRSTRAELAR